MRVKIKICGITNVEDALAAAEAGADALGFMFYADSPRCLELSHAAALIQQVPPFVARVGVFVDPTEAYVRQAIACGLDTLQFHGTETPVFCRQFGLPAIKAIRVQDLQSLEVLPKYALESWLLDSYVPGRQGGTGAAFNWDLAVEAKKMGRPVILAGGLNPDNVGEAARRVQPYAVDVSSGVESQPGKKDPDKIRAFIKAVHARNLGGNGH